MTDASAATNVSKRKLMGGSMKSHCLFALVSFIILCMATNGAAQEKIECSGNPEACAFFRHFVTVFNERDWIQFRACLADDITVMFDSPASPERKNLRTAVEAMFRPLFPDSGATPGKNRFLIKPEDVLLQDLGDVVVITFHLRQPDQIARRSLVLRRHKTTWEIVHIHASSFDVVRK